MNNQASARLRSVEKKQGSPDPVSDVDTRAADDRRERARARRRRARLSPRTKFDLAFDILLFIGFVFVYADDFTGLGLHEWIGIAFGAALLVHLSLHWDWVVRTTRRMLTVSGRRRFMWLLNFMLAADLVLCIGSGIVISGLRVFGVTFSGDPFWSSLHGETAVVAVALVGIHIGLDWRWVTSALRRMTRRSPRRSAGADDED